MARKTTLNETHRALGARMVDFGGWDMPLNYGSQLDEHHAVRQSAGMFDVSHMATVDIEGADAGDFLRYLLANDVAKIGQGQALYSCMLNADGGVVDDLIVYKLDDTLYRTVLNAGNAETDVAWIRQQVGSHDVNIKPRTDLAILAVQGPDARDKVLALLADDARERMAAMGKFRAADAHTKDGAPLFIARTGYTGEDGFEISLPQEHVIALWQALVAAGVTPCGLGARDTLRLEAGLNLYGQDMDASVSPLECGLGWTVALDDARDFIGRSALEKLKQDGIERRMVGVVMDAKGVLRHGQTVLTDAGDGEILSGIFSPTIGKAIGFARVPVGELGEVKVAIRKRELALRVVAYPFVIKGKPRADI